MRTISLADVAIYTMIAAVIAVMTAQVLLIHNKAETRAQCYAAPCEGGVRIFAEDRCFCVVEWRRK